MKKIAILIVSFAVIFVFLLTPTEILNAQPVPYRSVPFSVQRHLHDIMLENHLKKQREEAQQEAHQRALVVAVCCSVGTFGLIMLFYVYMKERDKKEREWREKQDEKNREFLAKKLQENRDSDPPDK